MIRPAAFLDILSLLKLCDRYIEEEVRPLGHHSAEWNADETAHQMSLALTRDDLFLEVAVEDGQIVGFLWAFISPTAPWKPDLSANDFLFYVVPERRGSMNGLRLIKAYRAWAESMGCNEVSLSLASGINEERIGKMYEKLGFNYSGTVYTMKLGG